MTRTVRCPQCKTRQPYADTCLKCGLNFAEYAELHKKKLAEKKPARTINCPKCKARQPLHDVCTSCGLDFNEYAEQWHKRRAQKRAAEARAAAPTPPASSASEMKPEEKKDEVPEAAEIRTPLTLGKLFSRTWGIYKGRLLTLLGLYLISIVMFMVPFFAVMGLAALVAGILGQARGVLLAVGSLLGILLGSYGFGVAMAGFISATVDETQDFKTALREGYGKVWSFLWLISLVVYIVGGGFMLFFIPGLVFMIWFFPAQFIIFKEDVRGMEAVLRSREYVRGRFWDAFLKLLIVSVVAMLVGLVPVLGSLLFAPFMMIYLYLMYDDYRVLKGPILPEVTRGSKFKWLAMATVGYVLPFLLLLLLAGTLLTPVLKGVLMQMQGLGQGPAVTMQAPGGTNARLGTTKQAYASSEQVQVRFSGLPVNQMNWITVVKATAAENTYGEWFYTGGKQRGQHSFGNFPPGRYEARAYFNWPTGGYNVMVRHAFVVTGAAGGGGGPGAIKPELKLDQVGYGPGQRISVSFKIPSGYAQNAWIGIVPSSVPHGRKARNDRNDIAYKYLKGRTSGKIAFNAPSRPGIYDVRMHNTDDGGREVASVTFAVEASRKKSLDSKKSALAVPAGGAFIITLKQTYASGEQIQVEYSGLPGNQQDWITLVKASAAKNTYGDWFYTKGVHSGQHTFAGLSPGSYEVRVYTDWPDGGFSIKARHAFTVAGSSGTSASR